MRVCVCNRASNTIIRFRHTNSNLTIGVYIYCQKREVQSVPSLYNIILYQTTRSRSRLGQLNVH